MSACGSKDCMCLPEPNASAVQKPMCGYLNRDTGLVQGCSTDCCFKKCPSGRIGLEYLPSSGINLPKGFGNDIVTSDLPTPPPGAFEFVPAPPVQPEKFTILIVLVVLMLIGAILS